MLGGLGRGHGSEAGRGVGATGVTPTMGVVVAVPGRRQLDPPPRSLVLFSERAPAWPPAEKGAAAPQVCFAQLQRPVRGLGRTFGCAAFGDSPTLPRWRGLVARHKQGFSREQP